MVTSSIETDHFNIPAYKNISEYECKFKQFYCTCHYRYITYFHARHYMHLWTNLW